VWDWQVCSPSGPRRAHEDGASSCRRGEPGAQQGNDEDGPSAGFDRLVGINRLRGVGLLSRVRVRATRLVLSRVRGIWATAKVGQDEGVGHCWRWRGRLGLAGCGEKDIKEKK
jgi:hypothetical protein